MAQLLAQKKEISIMQALELLEHASEAATSATAKALGWTLIKKNEGTCGLQCD